MKTSRRSFLGGLAALVPASAILAISRGGDETRQPLQAGDPLYLHGGSLMPYPRKDASFVSCDGTEAVVDMADGTRRSIPVLDEPSVDVATRRWNELFDDWMING